MVKLLLSRLNLFQVNMIDLECARYSYCFLYLFTPFERKEQEFCRCVEDYRLLYLDFLFHGSCGYVVISSCLSQLCISVRD
jgi:hypothetical protein